MEREGGGTGEGKEVRVSEGERGGEVSERGGGRGGGSVSV